MFLLNLELKVYNKHSQNFVIRNRQTLVCLLNKIRFFKIGYFFNSMSCPTQKSFNKKNKLLFREEIALVFFAFT